MKDKLFYTHCTGPWIKIVGEIQKNH